MDKGIRQLGRELRLSHTAIANAMRELGITGKSQGQGKPTLLNDAEQARIAEHLGATALTLHNEPQPQSSQVSIVPSDVTLPVARVERLELAVTDSRQSQAMAIQQLMDTLQTYQANGQSLEDAMLQDARRQGAELGTQIAITKLGTAIATSQAIEKDSAKKLGLLQDSDTSS